MEEFFRGVGAPIRAIRMIASQAELRRLAVRPFVINVIVFVIGIPLAVWGATALAGSLVGGSGAWLVVLRTVVQLLAIAAVLFLALILFPVVGNIIASPFNSKLSAAVEQTMRGPVDWITATARRTLPEPCDVVRAAADLSPPVPANSPDRFYPRRRLHSSARAQHRIRCTVLAIDFSDFAFERHIVEVHGKFRYVWRRKGLYLGFGLTILVMALIPLLNFVLLPVGAAGPRFCSWKTKPAPPESREAAPLDGHPLHAMQRIRLIHWNADEAAERAERLRVLGFEVSADVPTLAQLRALRYDPPDAIVIDLTRLPMQGRDIMLMLWQNRIMRSVPVVFVDGAPEKVERVRESLPEAAYTTWARIAGTLRRVIREGIAAADPGSIMAPYAGRSIVAKLVSRPACWWLSSTPRRSSPMRWAICPTA